MLDDTMGPALVATLPKGQFAPTVNLSVSIHRPARIGVITGKGRILRRGKELSFMSGELYQDGQMIASGTATAMVRELP
jgi:acyl-coenzyme A thioesterase PaaI-like protein